MNSFVNLKLLAHPLNWMTVAIWVFFVGFAAVHLGIVPPKNTNG